MSLVAGIDIGGTKTLAVAAAPDGEAVATIRLATRAGDQATVAAFVVDTVGRLATAAGIGVEDLAAIGVGLPGMVDSGRGTVRHAVNLGIGATPVDLGRHLEDATGVRATIVNDVDAAALGAAQVLDADDLAYLSVGTGVAAGFVFEGRLRRSRRGAVGEIGHAVVDPSGPTCPCGQSGCLEALVSGPAIARRWTVPEGAPVATHLVAAAANGDGAATAVLRELARHLASAVTLLTLSVDADVVVLGGGVAEAGDLLAAAVRTELRERAASVALLGELDLASRLVLLPVGAAPGAVGAALVARQSLAAAAPAL